MYSVYILKCSDSSHYIGCTSDFERRLDQHQRGLVRSTRYRLPVKPEVIINFEDKYRAYFFEKYLKSGSGRAFAKRHFLKDFKRNDHE